MSFDDAGTRAERWKTDRFAACREVFELWNEQCGAQLQMDAFVAIDECLYSCRNRIAFKQYNPSKPAKYGILFKCLNEVKYPFTHRSEVFAGRPVDTENAPYYFKTTEQLTLRLVNKTREKQDMKGQNLTTDNLYTSVSLANKLLDKGITSIGTLRSNRLGIPAEIKKTDTSKINSTEVIWEAEKQKLTITSYCVKTSTKSKKIINILSSMPPLLAVTKDEKKKPAIFKLYDFTKGGTDISDQRADKYTTANKQRKWTSKPLNYMLDTTRVNSQTIHSLNNGIEVRSRDSFEFGWSLVKELVLPHMKIRSEKPGLQRDLKLRMQTFLDLPVPDSADLPELFDSKTTNRRRCAECLSEIQGKNMKKNKEKLARMESQCQMCKKCICKKHTINACQDCIAMIRSEEQSMPDEELG